MTTPGRLSVEDRLDIRDLYSRWCVLLDDGEARAWADLYTATGVFAFPALDVRAEGAEALRAFAAEVHDRERGLTRHYMHNVLLEVDERGVGGRADIELLDLRSGGEARIVKTAHYEDRLARTAAGWRFAERCLYWDTPGAPAEIGTSAWEDVHTPVTKEEEVVREC